MLSNLKPILVLNRPDGDLRCCGKIYCEENVNFERTTTDSKEGRKLFQVSEECAGD